MLDVMAIPYSNIISQAKSNFKWHLFFAGSYILFFSLFFLILPIWRENRCHWESNMSKNKTVTTVTICKSSCYTICQSKAQHTLY